MVLNIRIILVSMLVLGLASFVGCRSAITSGDDDDIAEFDAAVKDGGGQQKAECTEDAMNIFNNDFSPYFGGDESVDVEVVHYSSFSCIHCADFADDSKKLWADRPDIQKRVRIYYHHSSYSSYRHIVSAAAQNQGMEYFWGIHDFIYETMLAEGSGPGEEEIMAYAEDELGLNMEQLQTDIADEETRSFLKWDAEQGQSAGVAGTPAVFVCGEKISRSQLEDEIDRFL